MNPNKTYPYAASSFGALNAAQAPESGASLWLVEIVELKWLMAGHGVRVHVEQLQHDREYARRTLDHAASLPNAALREAALRLRLGLGLA